MGVTNRLTQQLDVIEFILTTIVSAPYKVIIRSNLQKENFFKYLVVTILCFAGSRYMILLRLSI
jgi:hypothetical protein